MVTKFPDLTNTCQMYPRAWAINPIGQFANAFSFIFFRLLRRCVKQHIVACFFEATVALCQKMKQ